MEMLKLPAGRLATIFYKAEPQDFASEKNSTPSDAESGAVDEGLPPITVQSRQSGTSRRHILGVEGHVFAWKNICLDIKSGEAKKRLLDNLDGKSSLRHLCPSE
jgi:ATP-binding cassette subfamily G (WHITE) protein 2 (SNQ2)